MRTFLLLCRLRLSEVVRSPLAVFWLLGMPVAMLVVTALVFMNGHPFERRHVAVVMPALPPDQQSLTAIGLGELAAFPELRLEPARSEAAALGKLRARMVNAVLVPDGGRYRLMVGPLDQLLGRGVQEVLAGRARVEIVPVPRWGYVHYIFPGLLAMVMVLGGLFGMGHHMARYRQSLFLKKLATTPLPRITFVAAQIAGRSLLVLVQIVALVLLAHLGFGLPLSPGALPWLGVIVLLGTLTFMGVGFLLAAIIRDDANLLDAINAATTPIVFFSEIFFSLDELPAPLARACALLPSTQIVRLSRAVLLYGETSAAALLPGLLLILLWMALCYAASVRTFRWYGE